MTELCGKTLQSSQRFIIQPLFDRLITPHCTPTSSLTQSIHSIHQIYASQICKFCYVHCPQFSTNIYWLGWIFGDKRVAVIFWVPALPNYFLYFVFWISQLTVGRRAWWCSDLSVGRWRLESFFSFVLLFCIFIFLYLVFCISQLTVGQRVW